jgi:hypothetical protein
MEVTNEQRLELLKAHNDLKHILQNIWDCQDIWMSDVGKFIPKKDEDGHRMHYADWILDEDDA